MQTVLLQKCNFSEIGKRIMIITATFSPTKQIPRVYHSLLPSPNFPPTVLSCKLLQILQKRYHGTIA